MAKQPSDKNAPSALAIGASAVKQATGTDKPKLDLQLVQQAVDALWTPEGLSKKDRLALAGFAIDLLLDIIKPADKIEGMLATQMVGTHSAAMECLRRAMLTNQTFAGCEQNLKYAAKLMSIYARQIDALNKQRGKGQQKVTVEHVHVEAGGQAMVGHIETAPKPSISGDQFKDTPKAITHAPQKTFEMNSRTRVPAKRRDK